MLLLRSLSSNHSNGIAFQHPYPQILIAIMSYRTVSFTNMMKSAGFQMSTEPSYGDLLNSGVKENNSSQKIILQVL